MKYRRKPTEVIVEAITFDQLVQRGRDSGAPIINGMPWSFTYKNLPVTHEKEDLYIITNKVGTAMTMTPSHILITDEFDDTYESQLDWFFSNFEPAEQPTSASTT